MSRNHPVATKQLNATLPADTVNSLKQFNCTVPADDVNSIKQHCYLNGITLSGMTRFLLTRVLTGEIQLDLEAIRRADYEQRAKGSRF